MKAEIPKTYEPKDHEDTIYLTWEESGLFNTDTCIEKGIITPDAPPFSIVLPPPNVTGTLHLGHAAMLAIEDIMVRYHRMRGDRTLWIPGTDHAAIATQEKVERTIWNEEQKTRHDFGREIFLDRVKKFAQDSHDTIVNQCKKMGASLDWSREAYTLDEARNRAVNEAFRRMFEDGIIYRGPRIVNWDPKFQTTVSDDEVERREEKVPLYYLQYGPFVISTARPETKFGDKYVVVHPDDERYRDYAHGQTIENIEWINGKITATVIKDEAIDMEFGTGAMTITPWHDATDFDIATRHNLDKEQIIGYDGKLLDIAGEDFQGLDITQARKKIVEKLQEKNLVVKTDEDYLHNITVNSRGGGIIEPQIKEQWFVDVNKEFEREGKSTSLKSLMQHAVRSGNVTIIPERFEKTYFHWIDNLRDWCISRQIWFGHRIPVWYRGKDVYCGINAPEGAEWEQDPDTLDTWFSSGLWTFSTLGWGSNEEKWQREKVYHPTSVLETGYDILFFWVARMILMSEYLLGEAPFKTAYLHGLVRDEQGRKMSKSIGNVIDPLEMTAKYGTDAVRLALVIGSTPGNDIRLGEEKIATFRNFTNKLWNIGRYILQQPEKTDTSKALSDADHWILSRLNETVREVTHLVESYQFSLAGETLRDFTWNDFADWYVEVHKVEGNNT
ncbi:MAG: valine--tRNA ligase, partial [Candidatus Moraniibacteriota bacterium]